MAKAKRAPITDEQIEDTAPIESEPTPIEPAVRPLGRPIAEIKDPLQLETQYWAFTVIELNEDISPGDLLVIAGNTRSPFEVIVRDAAAKGTNLVNTQLFTAPYMVPQRTLVSKID